MAVTRFEITDQIAYIGDGSYPIAAISSLRVATKLHIGSGIALGIITLVLFSVASNEGGGWMFAAFVALAATIGCFIPEYILFIRTAGGEASVLNSRKRKEIDAMRLEIEAAIIARSRPTAG